MLPRYSPAHLGDGDPLGATPAYRRPYLPRMGQNLHNRNGGFKRIRPPPLPSQVHEMHGGSDVIVSRDSLTHARMHMVRGTWGEKGLFSS